MAFLLSCGSAGISSSLISSSSRAQFVVLFGREDLFGFGEVVQRRPVFFAGFDHRLQFFILFVQRYEFFHIGDHFRIGHLLADLFVFDLQSVEA